MSTVLQCVDPDDFSVVLSDFNDATGVNNPYSVQTTLMGDPDDGPIPVEREIFESGGPGGRVVHRRYGLRNYSFRFRATRGGTTEDFVNGVSAILRTLDGPGVMKRQLDGQTTPRYIRFEDADLETLIGGNELTLFYAARMLDSPKGLTVSLIGQPFLEGTELVSATNALVNPTLLLDADGAGTPDSWVWVSTADITAQSIDAAREAYTFTIATTSARDLRQSTATGTAAAGDVWTFYFYGWVSAGTDVKARARIEYLTSADVLIGSAHDGTLTTLGTVTPDLSDPSEAISVTTPAAPATTSKVRVSIRFENSAATSRQVWLTLGQLTEAAAVAPYRTGLTTMTIDPSV